MLTQILYILMVEILLFVIFALCRIKFFPSIFQLKPVLNQNPIVELKIAEEFMNL